MKELGRSSNYRRVYGVDIAEYERLLEAQDGRCAICGSTDPRASRTRFLQIDHDHVTGKIRGLLCSPCNLGIGKFDEDLARLEAAARYLRDNG